MAGGLGPTYKSKDTCLTPRVGPHGARQGRSDGRRRRLEVSVPKVFAGTNGMVVVSVVLPQYQNLYETLTRRLQQGPEVGTWAADDPLA